MSEKTFVVDVSWTMSKQINIKANSIEEAEKLAEQVNTSDGVYVEDSFLIDYVEEVDPIVTFDNQLRAAINKYGDHHVDIIVDEKKVYGVYHSSINSFDVTDTYSLTDLGGVESLEKYEAEFEKLCIFEN